MLVIPPSHAQTLFCDSFLLPIIHIQLTAADGSPVEVFESGTENRNSVHDFAKIEYTYSTSAHFIFSGAILLYLSDLYGGTLDRSSTSSAAERAKYTKWVVWANAELDGLCFGKGMSGSQLDKPSRALDTLEALLGKSEWIADNKFSVADVAIASYLNYVPVFFGYYTLSPPLTHDFLTSFTFRVM
jgi:hypothetical protein